jgi:pimeloyl-ACP methyl ester carboxylesterase
VVELKRKYREQAVLFGAHQSLLGVVTRPLADSENDSVAIVILNTGIVHRVGHHRMYVTMARLFAGLGHTVVRFDFSGIGDSEQRANGLSPLTSALADIKDAIDMLEHDHQAARIVLVGLCSGADHAVLYGHTDPRVVGLVLMDPTIPPTARYYFHYVAQRLKNLRHWISVATGRSGLLRLLMRQLRRDAMAPQAGALTLEELPFSPFLTHCYKQSVERGIRILAAFTSISPRQTYRQQMLDAFPDVAFKDRLKMEFFPDSDHLFSSAKDRSRLNGVIVDWLSSEQAHA